MVDPVNGYHLTLIQFESAVTIYSVTAGLGTGERDGACAILFLGGNREQDVVAVTEPIL